MAPGWLLRGQDGCRSGPALTACAAELGRAPAGAPLAQSKRPGMTCRARVAGLFGHGRTSRSLALIGQVRSVSLDGAFGDDPLAWFQHELARASQLETFDATRAALATVDTQGRPSVRYVLVRQVDARGFAFFTNTQSAKASALQASPVAALAFHWASTGTQVRVEGPVELLEAADNDAYFASRPRQSQLAAWASDQSRPIESRAALDGQLDAAKQRFPDNTNVPRPPHWGGFRVRPQRIELWRDRDFRMHDRWSFTRALDSNEPGEGMGAWARVRLQP